MQDFEPVIVDGNGNYFLVEVIDGEPYIQRDALAVEIAAFREREAQRRLAAENLAVEGRRQAAAIAAVASVPCGTGPAI